VCTVGNEARQPFLRLGIGIRPRDAGGVEAAGARFLDQRRFDAERLAQKSRSA
jgi:hypothetical protein